MSEFKNVSPQNPTEQMQTWSSDFGKSYTDRNPQTFDEMEALYQRAFGLTRSSLNKEFLGDLDRSIKILEVGCNVGSQLQGLKEMGFTNLYGIELQSYAVQKAKERTVGINIIQGSAFDLPFKDKYFDLVFTSGVLIHISPEDINKVLDEMHRCAKSYVWGFEYYAETYTNVKYHQNANLMWKTNFKKLFLDRFADLKLLKEKKIKYLADANVDEMYLLEVK